MNIFDYNGKEFDKKLDNIFNNIDKDNLMKELIDCGLEVKGKEDNNGRENNA